MLQIIIYHQQTNRLYMIPKHILENSNERSIDDSVDLKKSHAFFYTANLHGDNFHFDFIHSFSDSD